MKTYPCQGLQGAAQGVQTASVGKPYTIPDGLSGAYKQLSEQLSEPQPFTLTWNGKHYVPNFVPTDIRVVAYTQAQYAALNEAYQATKHEASLLRKANQSLCDRIDYLTEKTLALQHLYSAKKYLQRVDSEAHYNYHSQMVLSNAVRNVCIEEFDYIAAKKKYDSIDETGHFKEHEEERSI